MTQPRVLITVAPSIPPGLAHGVSGLDLSPEGVAHEVVAAARVGASIAHLHVWDEQGRPSTDLRSFERTIALIRNECDIIIEGSTGGVNDLSAAERSVSLRADIEMASLNPGSVNYDQGVYVNSPADVTYWSTEMQRRAIKPNAAIFEAGMIATMERLGQSAGLERPLAFTFVLGQSGALPASARNLLFLAESVPAGSLWTVAGHGGHDLEMAMVALVVGGHVRAGFEDNIWYRPGIRAESNAQLIGRLVDLATQVGREVATPAQARAMLGLIDREMRRA